MIDRIDRLPAEQRERLSYWRGFCALDTDPASALEDLTRAHAASAAAGDADGELLAAAALATALVSLGRLQQLDRWLDVLTRHSPQAAVVHPEEVEMRLVPGLLAAMVYRAPWHPLVELFAERAERLLHRQAAPGQRLLLGSLAFHLLWRGHIDRLQRIVLRIDALCAEPLAAPATRMRWWGVGILVKTLLGQTDSAFKDAQQALALVEAEPSVAAQRASVELLNMIVALAVVDAAAARRHLQRAAHALHPDNAVDRTTLEHQVGMLALLEDDRPTALRALRASVASATASGFPMRQHLAPDRQCFGRGAQRRTRRGRTPADRCVYTHPFHAICRWHHWVGDESPPMPRVCRGDQAQALVHLRVALAPPRLRFPAGADALLLRGHDGAAGSDGIGTRHRAGACARPGRAQQPEGAAQADDSWPWAVRIHALGRLSIERADGPLRPAGRKAVVCWSSSRCWPPRARIRSR